MRACRKSQRGFCWLRSLQSFHFIKPKGVSSFSFPGLTSASPRTPGGSNPEYGGLRSQVISFNSFNGEPLRSSGEFYSLSNNTAERWYQNRTHERQCVQRSLHNRRHNLLAIGLLSSESLVMGYAQAQGILMLGGSLM